MITALGRSCRLDLQRLHRGRQGSGRSSLRLAFSAKAPRRCAATRAAMAPSGEKLDKNTPDSKWKEILSAEEYHILRDKGTERPGTGLYNKHKDEGNYYCAGCGAHLYTSKTKFDSGCGWPAFYAEVPGSVDRHEDRSMFSVRTEITCKNCGGHLGHVFEGEGFPTPTDQRHCVNSKSIKFNK